jgi:hypothetical protein
MSFEKPKELSEKNYQSEIILSYIERLYHSPQEIRDFLNQAIKKNSNLFENDEFIFNLLNKIFTKLLKNQYINDQYSDNYDYLVNFLSQQLNHIDEKIKFFGLLVKKLIIARQRGRTNILFNNYQEFTKFIISYENFVYFLENSFLDFKEYKYLFLYFPQIKENPIYYILIIFAYGLDINLFNDFKEFIKQNDLPYKNLIDEFEENVKEINKLLNKKYELDNSKPSYGIEIESLNVDKYLEIDSPITNNYQEIVNLIKEISYFYQILANKIFDICENNPNFCQENNSPIISLYNSLHINIGFPNKSTITLEKSQEILRNLKPFLIIVGLIFNTLDRSLYALDLIRSNKLIEINEIKNYRNGYEIKLQFRMLSLNFLQFGVNDYEFYESLFKYLEKIFTQSFSNLKEIIENDIMLIIKILEEEGAEEYLELIKKSTLLRMDNNKIEITRYNFNEFYGIVKYIKDHQKERIFFPKRDEILKRIINEVLDK